MRQGDAVPRVWRFGPFELDCRERRLCRDGEEVPLQEQPFRALEALVVAAGRLVPREELRDAVWRDDVHVDFDAGLNYCVREIRRALGDDAREPTYIETVPRVGHRFLVPARPAASGSSGPRAGAPARRGAALGSILVLGLLAAVSGSVVSITAATGGPVRLAVLPLRPVDPDPVAGSVGDGLTEELVSLLATAPPERLTVLASTTGRRIAAAPEPMELARSVEATHWLQGSVRTDARGVRVAARVLEVDTGRYVWSRVVERPHGRLLDLQAEIAREVAHAISAALLAPTAAEPPVMSARAEAAYLRGRYLLARGDRAARREAAAAFAAVVESTPGSARAWAGRATALLEAGIHGDGPPAELWRDAGAAAARALAVDPEDVEALVARALVDVLVERRMAAAGDVIQQARRRHPGDARVRRAEALWLAAGGDARAAAEAARAARRLDPLSPAIVLDVGFYEYLAGHFDRAVRSCEATAELDPRFVAARRCVWMAHLAAGRLQEAARVLASSAPETLADLPEQVHRDGEAAIWHRVLAQLDAAEGWSDPVWRAVALTRTGRMAEAESWLNHARSGRSLWLALVELEPLLEPLRARRGA